MTVQLLRLGYLSLNLQKGDGFGFISVKMYPHLQLQNMAQIRLMTISNGLTTV